MERHDVGRYVRILNAFMTAAIVAVMTACSSSADHGPEFPDEPSAGGEQVSTPTGMIIYEVNPLFFASEGCLDAVMERIPEIRNLGTDVLWLMPIYPQGEKNAIGSPYCVKDYTAVNPRYGDMKTLKTLVETAHSSGMKVILDWVANHTAWDNPWITEHPDWFLQNGAGEIVSPPGQNWNDVAQLNYDSRGMRDAMIAAMKYWVTEAGVDGFRCDYADGVPQDFWKEAVAAVKALKTDAFMLAESSDFSLYSEGFDMIYDWAYTDGLRRLYAGTLTLQKFTEEMAARTSRIPEGKNIMQYVFNHDVLSENSPASMLGSPDAVAGAYVLTAFMGQVPLVYSGMEAGFDDRTPFIGAKPLVWNPELLEEYVSINKAYKATEKARAGVLKPHQSGSGCFVFSHENDDAAVLVAVNPTDVELQIKVPMAYIGAEMTDLLTGGNVVLPSVISIPAYGYKIFHAK